ncbi:MAG TPA: hypothetical protein VFI31_16615 [Pirellulales bacterium]|nr:hypothetical protein [Pirellulales bacterium]
MAGELLDFDDKLNWFRDDYQRELVAKAINQRLADERVEVECRYLMRFWFHLGMTYREVSYDELVENVSPEKMVILERLFGAILTRNFDTIDAWVVDCESLPMLECRFLGEDEEAPHTEDSQD